jgi:D-aspartate ligase
VGIASDPDHFCCRTRACSRIITADTNGPALIDCLSAVGPSCEQKPVLVPCTDNSVLQIAWHREQLGEWYHIAQPAAKMIEILTDKARFPRFAEEHGLPVPKSFTLASLADVQHAATLVNYPAVLKPAMKTIRWQQHTSRKAIVVNSAEQLQAAFQRYSAWSQTLLLQEWIPGPLENHFTCDAYFDSQSQPLVTFTSRKLRQWPVETGVGSISQECDNPMVRQEAIRLFQAAGFHGLAYVEMKQNEETGEYLIIEPNVGRPTGRSTCAEATAVEMLYTMYCDVIGQPLPTERQQRFTGIKWIYWKRDLRASWDGWRRGDLTFASWWRSTRGRKTCAVFSWTDPLPFLADWMRVFKKSLTPETRREDMAAVASIIGEPPESDGSPTYDSTAVATADGSPAYDNTAVAAAETSAWGASESVL